MWNWTYVAVKAKIIFANYNPKIDLDDSREWAKLKVNGPSLVSFGEKKWVNDIREEEMRTIKVE